MRFDFNAIVSDNRIQWLRNRAPLLLGLLLVIAAAWQAAALTWSTVTTLATEPVLPPPATLAASGEPARARPSMQAVAMLHVFGTAETSQATLAAAAVDAPETRLNLKLRGILAANEAGLSRAIISSGNQDKVYSVGDPVPGGATVEAVLPDRVLLRRAGRLETLRLPRELADTGITYTEEPTGETFSEVEQMRQEIVEDPARLSELVRYSPVLQDGEIRGYRLYPGQDRARFAELGLQPGDVLIAINGTELSDPGRAMEMLNSLTDQSNIVLTVERGGTRQDITLSPSM